MLHSSDINDIVNAKWHYILSDESQISNPKEKSPVPGGIPHLAGV